MFVLEDWTFVILSGQYFAMCLFYDKNSIPYMPVFFILSLPPSISFDYIYTILVSSHQLFHIFNWLLILVLFFYFFSDTAFMVSDT